MSRILVGSRQGAFVKVAAAAALCVALPAAAQNIVVGSEGVSIDTNSKARSGAPAAHRHVNADLDGHSFSGLKMRGAAFVNVSAAGADFSGADFSGAVWVNGKVCGANSIGRCR